MDSPVGDATAALSVRWRIGEEQVEAPTARGRSRAVGSPNAARWSRGVAVRGGQLDVLQVGVFESGAVFQAVPDRAIDADVCEPDQADLNRELGVGDHPDRRENDGMRVGVGPRRKLPPRQSGRRGIEPSTDRALVRAR